MAQVKIKIGSITFDHADYDDENDVLYLHIGEPRVAEGEETPQGDCVRFPPGTQEIVGLTILSPRRRLERDGTLVVTLPETTETSAETLAPAFAAV